MTLGQIVFENVSKQYRLGTIGTGTLSHDLNRWWHRVRGKDDPYIRIGEANDRTTAGNSSYVWALRGVSMQIEQGEVVGIIGRNGAGKSTLLKILSRITTPTSGSISGSGRIASLLEVGTGFHPEMTGRENIFMNGAIMGMTKREIRTKLDEIVDFAGVERYLDTPVKRFSSGMLVRLGFAVAAHLEPEILVVDEVLAVGDAEFQKKCIGKMESISRTDGRTILFVSHNMAAVENLCQRAVVLDQGLISFEGTAHQAVSHYLKQSRVKGDDIVNGITYCHSDLEILSIQVNGSEQNQLVYHPKSGPLEIEIRGILRQPMKMALELRLYDQWNSLQALYSPGHLNGRVNSLGDGDFVLRESVQWPENMTSGDYTIDLDLTQPNVEGYLRLPGHISLQVRGVTGVTGLEFNRENCGFIVLG